MSPEEYRAQDATGLAALVKSKQVSPREVLDVAIASIERDDPALNSVVLKMYDEARARVATGLPDGPFSGVPFALKDLAAAYAGVTLSNGCEFYGSYAPDSHAALVERYLGAGLVVVAKTNTPEFGLLPVTEPPRFGPTSNPWNPKLSAGGSSGGSAAAVAAGLLPMAMGGDGGGSIRIPASCCGIFGFKPSRGRNPTSPAVESWEGCTQEHVLTRSVRDSAAALDVTNVWHAGSPYFTPPPARPFCELIGERPRALRIACSAEPVLGRGTHPDCRRAVEDAASLLRELGHQVVEARPTLDRTAFIEAWLLFMAGQLAADVRQAERDVGRRATYAQFHGMTWLNRAVGEVLPAGRYVDAVRALKQVGRRFDVFLNEFDAWLCPTLGQLPPAHGAYENHGILAALERLAIRTGAGRALLWSGQTYQVAEPIFDFVSFTPLANVGGQPSMSVPLFWNSAGLPVGVLFTARFGQDADLLCLARQLEEARPWVARRPPRR
jgi:amidase